MAVITGVSWPKKARALVPREQRKAISRGLIGGYVTSPGPVGYLQPSAFGGGLADHPQGIALSALGSAQALINQGVRNMGLMFTAGGADTSSSGGGWGGGGGGFWDALGSIGGAVAGIYQAKEQNKALRRMQRGAMPTMQFPPSAYGVPAAQGFAPGAIGGAIGRAAPWLLGGLGAAAGSAGLLPDVMPGGLEESGTGMFGPDLFRPTAASARQRMIDAVHPGTGERVYWRPVGRPILFAGDAALLRRTRKLASKLNVGCGSARRTFRRRRRY